MSQPIEYRVLKLGGSSLGAPDRLIRSLDLVRRDRASGPLALVVSAMGDATDWLIAAVDAAVDGDHAGAETLVDRVADLATSNGSAYIAHLQATNALAGERPEIVATVRELLTPLRRLLYGVSLVRERTRQTLDLVMSFGEQVSARVVATLLSASGIEAVYLDARDWTVTDATFGNANVDWEATQARLDAIRGTWREATPVCTGFLGRTPDGRTTTLGRNGSDYTATLLARGLRACEVVRWTDVSGVMTADPGLVKDAYPLARLSYMEALELANFGAKVFHPRTMIPLIQSGIPMRIRNTMEPDDPGTLVDVAGSQDPDRPTSVTSLENLAMIGIEWRRVSFAQQAHIGDRVLRALDGARITIWMASMAAHGQALAVVVPMHQVDLAESVITREMEAEIERGDIKGVDVQRPVTLLSLVAEAMGMSVNVAGRFFHALGAVGVNIRAIAQGASSRSISCVIDAADTPVAVRTVHGAFNFAHQDVSLLVYGRGTVGAALIEQVRQQYEVLKRRKGVRVRIVGIATSSRACFDDEGLDLDHCLETLNNLQDARPSDEDLLDRLRRLPSPTLVDCTAAGNMDQIYRMAFARGISVVGANKKPLTIAQPAWAALMEAARSAHRSYHYETTVGASLPVIDTLKNIVQTGDRVLSIEGSFSGTLGYLTSELMRGVPLSKAVRRAKELGYTEPNPADDLSGLDVARKALILARELGLELELSDVSVEPLVPASVLRGDTSEELFFALEAYEATLTAQLSEMRERNETLRYLARIAPCTESGAFRVDVGPVALEASHPATRLRGAEAFVAFTTERFTEYPLIVQGAGAGGAVTAAGVLADILKVPHTMRVR